MTSTDCQTDWYLNSVTGRIVKSTDVNEDYYCLERYPLSIGNYENNLLDKVGFHTINYDKSEDELYYLGDSFDVDEGEFPHFKDNNR